MTIDQLPSGADRAVDPADAGSVVGGGVQPLGGGGRSMENENRPVANSDVRRSFRREIGRDRFLTIHDQ